MKSVLVASGSQHRSCAHCFFLQELVEVLTKPLSFQVGAAGLWVAALGLFRFSTGITGSFEEAVPRLKLVQPGFWKSVQTGFVV